MYNALQTYKERYRTDWTLFMQKGKKACMPNDFVDHVYHRTSNCYSFPEGVQYITLELYKSYIHLPSMVPSMAVNTCRYKTLIKFSFTIFINIPVRVFSISLEILTHFRFNLNKKLNDVNAKNLWYKVKYIDHTLLA